MIPALNPLVMSVKESATLAINLKALELRNNGVEVSHFGFGQSPFPVPELIQKSLIANADKNEYLPTRGLPELCTAIADFYQKNFGYHFSSDHVCVGPGSKELIFQTIYLVEGPLLVPAPSWVSYGPQAAMRGKNIIPITTKRENGYRLQAEELDKACHQLGHSQKLLIINNPNNPTGAVYKKHEIKELAEICRAYHVLVISDEIYAMIDFTDDDFHSIAQYYPEGTIVTGGLSKSFSAGGYRLGIMMVPKELEILLDTLKSVISETFSAVCAPVQYAALAAYGNFEAVRPFIEKTCQIHRFVGSYVHKRFIEMGLNCPKPEGSFYLFPDFEQYREVFRKNGILTGQRLCDTVLDQAQVALLPGSDFYFPATNIGVRAAYVDYKGADVLKKWTGPENLSPDEIIDLFPNIVKGCNSLEQFLKNLKGSVKNKLAFSGAEALAW